MLPLIEVVKNWGVTPDALLGPSGIAARDLSEPDLRLSIQTHLAIVERARALTGEPGLGFAWGLQMRVSSFGFLGFATLSAATLRDAIDLSIQFGALSTSAEGMWLHEEGGVGSLVLEEDVDFGTARDVLMIARLVALWRIGETLTGRELQGTAEVALPEPPYVGRFAHLVPEVRWGQPTTRLLFAAELLDYPLVMASPVALKLASDQCRRELQALGTGGHLVRSVRGALTNADGGFRMADQVARAMGLSSRTLRRRLTLAGSSLSAILDDARRDRALLLLRADDVSLAEVAERVGYQNVQNFERAFRRWTGMTPAAFRRS